MNKKTLMNKNNLLIFTILLFTYLLIIKVNFLCLLPALLAILLAFITHEVYLSLFMGLLMGVMAKLSTGHFFFDLTNGFFKTFDTYIIKAASDKDHVFVLLFTFFIGALVQQIRVSGGMNAIVKFLSPKIKSAKHAQLYTFFMGIIIFFDDYANTLIVGNSMRPITDKFKVSREKLSFIVDATAAPVSSLMMISTWIGYEVGLIGEAFKHAGIESDAYLSFVASVPFRFYGILMLFFIFSIIFLDFDFFTMKKANIKSLYDKKNKEKKELDNKNERSQDVSDLNQHINGTILHAVVPLLILILGVLFGLYYTGVNSLASGQKQSLQNILSSASSYKALLWASVVSSFSAMILNITYKKLMTLKQSIEHLISGFTEMLPAAVILVLAWSLGSVMKELDTAAYVSSLLKGNITYHYLPVLIFITAAITSFATGTSWGTMAIIFPIAIPLATELSIGLSPEDLMLIINATIGSVLSGAVFGDHCSPISDTTILSSIACRVNHIDHVKTQIPYALFVGIFSILFGYIPAGFTHSPYITITLSMVIMFITLAVMRRISKKRVDSV